MSIYQLFSILLGVLLLLRCTRKSNLIEGIDGVDGVDGVDGYTSDIVQEMTDNEFEAELQRIKDENYTLADGFEAMRVKGLCTDEPDTNKYHSCNIRDSEDTSPEIDLRYVNIPSDKLNESVEYTFNVQCLDKFAKTQELLMEDTLVIDPELYRQTLDPHMYDTSKFFVNKYSRGQYPGYSQNAYIHRTRYLDITEPLPTNPDFFLDGGGTFP